MFHLVWKHLLYGHYGQCDNVGLTQIGCFMTFTQSADMLLSGQTSYRLVSQQYANSAELAMSLLVLAK